MPLVRHVGLCSSIIVDFFPKWVSREKRSIKIGGFKTGNTSE